MCGFLHLFIVKKLLFLSILSICGFDINTDSIYKPHVSASRPLGEHNCNLLACFYKSADIELKTRCSAKNSIIFLRFLSFLEIKSASWVNFTRKAQYGIPDEIQGGTWEAFERVMKKSGYFRTGLRKTEAARSIGRQIIPERNNSHSFRMFAKAILAAFRD